MKILLDTCVWGKAADELRAAGQDVVWAGDWTVDPGDEEILRQAYRQGRTLVTLDKDFGELAVVRGQQHCGIVRIVNASARQQARLILHVLRNYETELRAGAMVTVEPGRVRIRPPDSGPD